MRHPPRGRGPAPGHEVEALRALGFTVEVEAVPADVEPWIDTASRVAAWLSRAMLPRAGVSG